MTDEEAAAIAETMMREQNVDNLQGFGEINIRRLKGMLSDAIKVGYRQGYSDGWREGERGE